MQPDICDAMLGSFQVFPEKPERTKTPVFGGSMASIPQQTHTFTPRAPQERPTQACARAPAENTGVTWVEANHAGQTVRHPSRSKDVFKERSGMLGPAGGHVLSQSVSTDPFESHCYFSNPIFFLSTRIDCFDYLCHLEIFIPSISIVSVWCISNPIVSFSNPICPQIVVQLRRYSLGMEIALESTQTTRALACN